MPESRMRNHAIPCFLLRSLDIHPSVDYQSTVLCDTVTIPLVLEATLEILVNLLCQFLQISLLCFHTQIPWQGFITQTIVLCNDCLFVYLDWFSPTQPPLLKGNHFISVTRFILTTINSRVVSVTSQAGLTHYTMSI